MNFIQRPVNGFAAGENAEKPRFCTVHARLTGNFRRFATLTVVFAALLLVFGCDSGKKAANNGEQKPAAAPSRSSSQPQQNEYITGRAAFQKLFVAARGFAPDVKPYRVESTYTKDAPVSEGKSGLWRAQFASPSKRSVKAYSWSGLTGADAPERGVSHSTEDTYNPSNSTQAVFDLPFLKIDTDQAFQVALKHGGSKIYEKDPKQAVVFVLDFDQKNSELLWHVIFGENVQDAKLRIAVDASTGQYVRTEH